MTDEPTQGGDATKPLGDATAKGRARRRVPPWPLLLVVLALLAGVAWFQRPERPDRLMGNSFSMGLGGLAVIVLVVWYTFLSGFSRKTRFLSVVCGLGLVLALAAMFRVDYVSGFGVPVFAPRWSPMRVALVDVPSSPQDETSVGVDLSATGENDFPRFLGPDRQLTIENVELARDWEAHPPREVWRQPIGAERIRPLVAVLASGQNAVPLGFS